MTTTVTMMARRREDERRRRRRRFPVRWGVPAEISPDFKFGGGSPLEISGSKMRKAGAGNCNRNFHRDGNCEMHLALSSPDRNCVKKLRDASCRTFRGILRSGDLGRAPRAPAPARRRPPAPRAAAPAWRRPPLIPRSPEISGAGTRQKLRCILQKCAAISGAGPKMKMHLAVAPPRTNSQHFGLEIAVAPRSKFQTRARNCRNPRARNSGVTREG